MKCVMYHHTYVFHRYESKRHFSHPSLFPGFDKFLKEPMVHREQEGCGDCVKEVCEYKGCWEEQAYDNKHKAIDNQSKQAKS